jgi:hypothetical protein
MSTQTEPAVTRRTNPRMDLQCPTRLHGTYAAWWEGCICKSAAEAIARYEESRDTPERREHDRALAAEARERELYVKRVTGGRLRIDPRQPWRGRVHKVDRLTVDAMVNGYPMRSTMSEKIAAVARVEHRIVAASPYRARIIQPKEIAKLIGMGSDREVYRIRQARVKLRKKRTERRLADSIWRAAVVAAARDKHRG